MKPAVLLCAVLASTLAKPNGFYHQEYNYQTSSSHYKNHELQHRNQDEGFYSKDGDLEGRLRPRVNAHSQHSEYVNPKLQHGYRLGTDRTSSFGQLHAQNRYAGGDPPFTQPEMGGAFGFAPPHQSYGIDSNLRQVTTSLEEEMERELQRAVYDHYQRAVAYGGGISQAQIETDRRLLEEELRRNVTMRLQEALKQHYGNQGIRGAYSYSIIDGRLQPSANYHNQELTDLTRQMEANLMKHLERQVQTYYHTRVDTAVHTQRNTYRRVGDNYPGELQQRPIYQPHPHGEVPIRPQPHPHGQVPIHMQPHPQPIPIGHIPDSITTVATRVQTELNEHLNKILEDTQHRYFSERNFQNRGAYNYDAILAQLQEELRANITLQFDEQIKRAYGYTNYVASKYSVEDIENLRRQIETNLLTKLNRDFLKQRDKFFQMFRVYEAPRPIPANHVYYPVNTVHQQGEMTAVHRQMQEQLSRQLQAALMQQSYRQAHMYTGEASNFNPQAHYQATLDQMTAELNRNLTRQMEQISSQQYQSGAYGAQLAAMRNQLQHELMRQLQQGLQQSYSRYSSWSSSASSSSSGNYRQVRGYDPNLYRSYGTSGGVGALGEDCMMGDDPSAYQQKDSDEDLTQQTEDLTQQTEDLTQQTQDHDDLTQQVQTHDDLTQQTQDDEDLTQQVQTHDDLTQQTQDDEDLTQQVQTHDDLTQQTQDDEDLTQQVQTHDDLTQQTQDDEDLTQQVQTHDDLTQQTQDDEDLTQQVQTHDDLTQQTEGYEDLTQQSQTHDDLSQQSQTHDDFTQQRQLGSQKPPVVLGPSIYQKPPPRMRQTYSYHPRTHDDLTPRRQTHDDLTQQRQTHDDLTQQTQDDLTQQTQSFDYYMRRPQVDLPKPTPTYQSNPLNPTPNMMGMPGPPAPTRPAEVQNHRIIEAHRTIEPPIEVQTITPLYSKPVVGQQPQQVQTSSLYSRPGGIRRDPLYDPYLTQQTQDLTQQVQPGVNTYRSYPPAERYRTTYQVPAQEQYPQRNTVNHRVRYYEDLNRRSQQQEWRNKIRNQYHGLITKPLSRGDQIEDGHILTQQTQNTGLGTLQQPQNQLGQQIDDSDLAQQTQDLLGQQTDDSFGELQQSQNPLAQQIDNAGLTQQTQDPGFGKLQIGDQQGQQLVDLTPQQNQHDGFGPSQQTQQSRGLTQQTEEFAPLQIGSRPQQQIQSSSYRRYPLPSVPPQPIRGPVQQTQNNFPQSQTQQTWDPTQQSRGLTQQSQDLNQQPQDWSQQNQELTQQTQDLIRQTSDLPHQSRDLTQQSQSLNQQPQDWSQNNQELTQQTQNLTQQTQPPFRQNNDLVRRIYFDQQTPEWRQQHQELIRQSQELPQQTQDRGRNNQDLTQQTQDLTQQSEDLTQQTQDFTQQSEDLTQQTQDLPQQSEDLPQMNHDLVLHTIYFDQQTPEWRQQHQELIRQSQELPQQTQDRGRNNQDLTQQTQDLTQQSEDLTQQTQDLTQQSEDIDQPIEPQVASNKIFPDQPSQQLKQQTQDLIQREINQSQPVSTDVASTDRTQREEAERKSQKLIDLLKNQAQRNKEKQQQQEQQQQDLKLGPMEYHPQPVYSFVDGHPVQVGTTRQLPRNQYQVQQIPESVPQESEDQQQPIKPVYGTDDQQVSTTKQLQQGRSLTSESPNQVNYGTEQEQEQESETVRDIEPIEPQVASEVQQIDGPVPPEEPLDGNATTTKPGFWSRQWTSIKNKVG
jgi:tellurite resistance protein